MVAKRSFTLAALVLSMSSSLFSQEPKEAFPLEQWLRGPDRHSFKWKVEVGHPRLTYQQRILLAISGSLDGAVLRRKPGAQFVVIVKLGDKDGNWFPGEDRNDYTVGTQPVESIDSLRFYTGVYVRPGDYRVAVIMYDAANGEGNVEHRTVHIAAPRKDPLPELDKDFPIVDFPARIPGMLGTPLHDPGWSLGEGKENLAIATLRPLRADVVLDVSEPDSPLPDTDASSRGSFVEALYRARLRITLEAGSVLSHLQLLPGCVRVSAIDMTRMQVFLDRQNAASIDWNRLQIQFSEVNHELIDVQTLAGQRRRSGFAAEFLTRIAADPGGCGDVAGPVDHVVILFSGLLRYPRHTPTVTIQPEQCPNCRFVYVRVTPFHWEYADPYAEMLKPLRPRVLHFTSPEEFRNTLSILIKRLAKM